MFLNNIPEEFFEIKMGNWSDEKFISTAWRDYGKWYLRFIFESAEVVEILEIY